MAGAERWLLDGICYFLTQVCVGTVLIKGFATKNRVSQRRASVIKSACVDYQPSRRDALRKPSRGQDGWTTCWHLDNRRQNSTWPLRYFSGESALRAGCKCQVLSGPPGLHWRREGAKVLRWYWRAVCHWSPIADQGQITKPWWLGSERENFKIPGISLSSRLNHFKFQVW